MTQSISPAQNTVADPGSPSTAIRAHITAALHRLNDLHGPDAIADRLHRLGIRGVCGDPGRCAIANYLTALTGLDPYAVLYVDHLGWDLWAPGDPDTRPAIAPMPDHVAAFIRRFDRNDYPDLHVVPGIDNLLDWA
ncbi:hypothetical protein Ae168Ps1_6414c [Pseudonocardia sp. Ae168_Ps1]|uniref:hypothetical protein n=1 Tax=unclassified Pseudonocardia TaxID=2619320 RepID=UPI00094B1B6B|nr:MULTISPECIES: hypothetical protein [unclassified Pseudonocardia]OLL69856.1 hypothetical protein Ae150APs1_6267c [Pseudonocardia sp. Ae150A_Ps1]OLL69989.1 hypothetical protein Ae168Ps1_6414c [Pseudonocardia sp. Ae168_Ps1]OLL89114.1 hypothetical protein Ae356Ps1_6230c [Pseudonocardia sp. Ae356_Ps1]